jgi:hypothetical protein
MSPAAATRAIRIAELRRRVEALPQEVESWRLKTLHDVDVQLHASQLGAIATLMDIQIEEQKTTLESLTATSAQFEDQAFTLVSQIIRAQRTWDFFRDKLELRQSEKFKDVLWVADTIAWDSYSRALAEKADVIDVSALREPPLTYLTAEFSPATWTRGSRPNDGRNYDLGTAKLPIPVIQLPWDHVENVWELASLMHEVGHDLEADLKLRIPLIGSLTEKLSKANVPEDRVQRWTQWEGETFADLVALQLGGPAYAQALFNLLLLPAPQVTQLDPDDPHPNHYVRMLMNAAYIPTLHAGNDRLAEDAKQLRAVWIEVYGEQIDPRLDGYEGDFPVVFAALMDTKLAALQQLTMRELLPFGPHSDAKIRQAASYLLTGQQRPADVRPRYWISAARLAVNEAAARPDFAAVLDQINERTMKMVHDAAPAGPRAAPNKQRIRALATAWLASGELRPKD